MSFAVQFKGMPVIVDFGNTIFGEIDTEYQPDYE
jgi:hypothetical protein